MTQTDRKRLKAKPDSFVEMESLVKEIFVAQELSYFEWLHQQH